MADRQSTNSAPSAQTPFFPLEVWLPVPEWEGVYEVSSIGRVRSLTRQIQMPNGNTQTFDGKIIASWVSKNGYPLVKLFSNGKKYTKTVHRLVARAFLKGPTPKRPHVNHKDGDKTNNVLSNLEFVSRSENCRHAVKNGLTPPPPKHLGESQHKTYLSKKEVLQIRRLRAETDMTYKKIGELFGAPTSTIWNIVNRKTWKHV